jgi:type VI protein secretion system component Hcp
MRNFLWVALSLVLAAPAMAQYNTVVNIAGQTSCSTAAGEPGFDVLTWSIGGTSRLGVGQEGSGASAPVLQDLVVNRIEDACSEQLIKDFVTGQQLTTVTLTQYKSASSGGLPAYAAVTVTLTDAQVASYTITGGNTIRPLENIDFLYNKMCVATVTQNPDGSLMPPQTVCYNVLTGKVN